MGHSHPSTLAPNSARPHFGLCKIVYCPAPSPRFKLRLCSLPIQCSSFLTPLFLVPTQPSSSSGQVGEESVDVVGAGREPVLSSSANSQETEGVGRKDSCSWTSYWDQGEVPRWGQLKRCLQTGNVSRDPDPRVRGTPSYTPRIGDSLLKESV